LAVQLEMTAKPGDRVLILCQPGLEYITSFYACLYAQMKAVPLYPPRNNKNIPRIISVANDVEAKTVLTTSAILNKMNQLSFDENWYEEKSTVRVDLVADDLADYWEDRYPTGDTVAFLQYTSGSTGAPKGVMVTHTNLCDNIEIIGEYIAPPGLDYHIVSWLPPYHDMGLIGGILFPVYFGYVSVTMPPESFVQKPYRWLALATKYPCSASPAPNFALELCYQKISDDELAKLDLRNWRHIICGSEPIRHTTMSGFSKRFATAGFAPTSLMPCYGLAECTVMVTGSSNETELVTLHVDKSKLETNTLVLLEKDDTSGITLVSSGHIAGDQELIICDTDSLTPLDDACTGEIWISSSCVAAGYWGKTEETEKTFKNHLHNITGKNYLRTGDLGFLLNGDLYVTGRIKDLMIVNGRNHYPQDIEYTVTSSHQALVTDGCAAFTVDDGKREQVVVVCEVKRSFRKCNFDPVFVDIRSAVSHEHDLPIEEIVLISPATLAKTTSGKIQRSQNRQMYLNKELTTLGSSLLSNNKFLDAATVDKLHQNNSETVESIIAWIRDYAETRVNSRLIDERRCIPPYIALDFGELGLMGMQIPKEYGGLGLNNQETLRIVEQLTAVDLTLAAFVGLNNSLGIYPILQYAKEEVKAELLPKLASGRMLASFAITEPGAGSNPRSISSTAKDLGDGSWSISGEKSWIGSSAWAGVINVFAKNDNGSITGFAVLQNTPGMRMGPEELTMGVRGMVQNSIYLEDAQISEQYMLGQVGNGMAIAQETMSLTRLGFGAIGLGGMRRCAQLMIRYASRRNVGSGLLLDNPVTLNRLNTLTLRIHALDHYVRDIARCMDHGIKIPEETLMVCKILGTEYLFDATDDLVQMLGGRGYIETNIAPQLFRDARLTRIFEGPTETLNMHVGSGVYNSPTQLLGFIEEHLHAPDVAEQLRQLVTLLKSREQADSMGLNKVKDQQWTYFLLGNVVQWALLKSALTNNSKEISDDKLHSRAIEWCEHHLNEALDDARLGRERLAWEIAHNSILEEIATYKESIGDLEQSAAGEKTILDEILIRNREKEAAKNTAYYSTESASVDDETLAEVHDWICSWVRKHMQIDDTLINQATVFSSIGLDSIQAAELMMDLSDKFGIEIDMSAAWDYPSIGSLSQAVVRLCENQKKQGVADVATA
jgi:acyl-CoA synthetase (AMP-forming)/AMP-acid ligase II/alkylation response protein AidB-like acyl-CoA dehydrogenase/acyl carrier protein